MTLILVLNLSSWIACAHASAGPLTPDRRNGTDGSCVGTAFSSPTGNFSAADIGKVIVISGDSNGVKPAGPPSDVSWNNAPLFTTVVAVGNSTSLTLASACNSLMQGVSSAQWDLGTDNTAALQSCLQVGTCNVPPGTYLVSGPPNSTPAYDSEVTPPSNSQLLCQPGAVFVFPHHDDYGVVSGGVYRGVNRSFLTLINVHDVTISGCTIVGTNLHAALTEVIESNYAILISLGAANNRIIGNTIRNGWSDGDIMINNVTGPAAQEAQGVTPPPAVPINNVISGNTFNNCGLNGIALVSGNGNTVENNNLTDCNIDVEPNSTANGPVFSNLIRGNTIVQSMRPGHAGTQEQGGLTRDSYGDHYYVFFSSCQAPACDTSGGSSIAVRENSFVREVTVFAYCGTGGAGSLSQIWVNNTISSANGGSCQWNTPSCPYTSGCQVPNSHGTNVNRQLINLIDDLVVN